MRTDRDARTRGVSLGLLGALLGRRKSNQPERCTKTSQRRLRPAVSPLEDRQLLATFTVINTLNDGAGSLHQAILQANAAIGADTINFSGLFNQKQEIRLNSALPILTDTARTTIQGPGSNLLTITGQHRSQIFLVRQGAQATITGLNLIDGRALTFSSGDGGGAIANAGNLVVSNCTISNNSVLAFSGSENPPTTSGGAVYNTGSLNITNCILSHNMADTGGAIDNVGTMVIAGSTIAHNSASYSGGGIDNNGGTLSLSGTSINLNKALGDDGAGIYNKNGSVVASTGSMTQNDAHDHGGALFNYGGIVTLTGLRITANKGEDGGGLYNNSGSKLTVINSIVEQNRATASVNLARGAGVATWGDTTLTGSTIAYNTADNSGGGIYEGGGTTTATNCTIATNTGTDGGGFCNSGGTINLINLTIAGNTSRGNNFLQSGYGGGLWTSGTSHLTNTLITGNTSDSTSTHNVSGSYVGSGSIVSSTAQVFLGPLANNGGPTPTMALLLHSPAIGTGVRPSINNPNVPTVDQRGFPRLIVTDVGAYQYSGN